MVEWVNDPASLCEGAGLMPSQVQWVRGSGIAMAAAQVAAVGQGTST